MTTDGINDVITATQRMLFWRQLDWQAADDTWYNEPGIVAMLPGPNQNSASEIGTVEYILVLGFSHIHFQAEG